MKQNAISTGSTPLAEPSPAMAGKTQISIRLDDDQYAALQRISLRRRSQVGVLVREAVQRYLYDEDEHFRQAVEESITDSLKKTGHNPTS